MSSVARDGYKFRQDITVPCYQTDSTQALRPASFMDMAQEIAYWAAEELGFGYSTLHLHHTAWVLSRMHIRFQKPVRWSDRVSLFTWHKGANGLFYLRDFRLKAPDGTALVDCTSSWVVINEQTRRLVRPEDIQDSLRLEYDVDNAIEEPAPKVVFPKEGAQAAGEHKVVYSDTDLIGHTNNARYMVWAMDALPEEALENPLKEVFINFNKETKLGETVQLTCCHPDSSVWYVEGVSEGKSCFVVKFVS